MTPPESGILATMKSYTLTWLRGAQEGSPGASVDVLVMALSLNHFCPWRPAPLPSGMEVAQSEGHPLWVKRAQGALA